MTPSPKVATYDLQPEMSAPELTGKVVAAIESGQYDLFVLNFANPDMVGHTGVLSAAIKAVETIDASLGRIADAILAKGVDDIAVVAVNDWHVMGAWAQNSGGMGKIHFLADWDGAFTKALGLDADLSAGGLGLRSKRYSMLVEDGVVKSLNVEENPGQATVSAAAAMLEQL